MDGENTRKSWSFEAQTSCVCHFCSGVDSMPQDLQRYVTQLREIELEKRGMDARTLLLPYSCNVSRV